MERRSRPDATITNVVDRDNGVIAHLEGTR